MSRARYCGEYGGHRAAQRGEERRGSGQGATAALQGQCRGHRGQEPEREREPPGVQAGCGAGGEPQRPAERIAAKVTERQPLEQDRSGDGGQAGG